MKAERKEQIKSALGLFGTLLTGSRKEVIRKGEALAKDAKRQIDAHRRPLNQGPPAPAVDADAQVVDDEDEGE